jgi:hypothetical protein
MEGLIVQCPHCLHLVSLTTGTLKNTTICWDCGACKKSIALPFVQNNQVKLASPPQIPEPVSAETDLEPLQIPASHIEALPVAIEEAQPATQHPIPEALAQQIDALQSDKPGALGIKNAFCRLWEQQWDVPNAHEKFVQKANQQNALPIAGQLYGAVLQRFPNEEMATAGREKVLNLGLLQLGHLRTMSPVSGPKITQKKLFWGVGLGIGLILVTLIFSTFNNVIHSAASLAK